ncbi:ThuA domain-containing protein [Streptomyces tauricus]|uniref:ThuA domain-containing protein n=1 Tax=Streptomyces tauricus TaxID=68274 RepID=UPI0034202968
MTTASGMARAPSATTTGATSPRPPTATGCSSAPGPPGPATRTSAPRSAPDSTPRSPTPTSYRTPAPRHANLGPALGAGLNPALADTNVVQNALVTMGREHGFAVDWTEDVTQLATPARLFRYNAVVFYSTSRDALDDAAQTSLRQYIRGGGGFAGIHNAFGTEYNWPWYEGLLGGANFYDHGPGQRGTVVVQNRRDSSTAALPDRWDFTDEWYNLVPAPSRVGVLATVDESTLAEGATGREPFCRAG